MTDLEITRLAAEAMGMKDIHGDVSDHPYDLIRRVPYDPLHDKAQAMELVERFRLDIFTETETLWLASRANSEGRAGMDENLCRAICLCVARLRMKGEG